MHDRYYQPFLTPPREITSAVLPTSLPCQPQPFRRTWKIVRSEISLDIEPPTSNDGACTIMSVPAATTIITSTSSSRRYMTLTPPEMVCVVWLDWQGHHAKFSCIYNAATDCYSRFVMDKASVDPPVKRWYVDINFPRGLNGANRRMRDENGELYMVLNIDIDEGWGVRRGKAYGRLMGDGVSDEDVIMTFKEELKLGCLVGLQTVQEQIGMVEGAKEVLRLEVALQQIRDRMKILSKEMQQIEEEEMDHQHGKTGEQNGKLQETEKVMDEIDTYVQETEKEREEETNNSEERMKFQFPSPKTNRTFARKQHL